MDQELQHYHSYIYSFNFKYLSHVLNALMFSLPFCVTNLVLNLCTAREVCLVVWPNVTGASNLRVLAPFVFLPLSSLLSLPPGGRKARRKKGKKRKRETSRSSGEERCLYVARTSLFHFFYCSQILCLLEFWVKQSLLSSLFRHQYLFFNPPEQVVIVKGSLSGLQPVCRKFFFIFKLLSCVW